MISLKNLENSVNNKKDSIMFAFGNTDSGKTFSLCGNYGTNKIKDINEGLISESVYWLLSK